MLIIGGDFGTNMTGSIETTLSGKFKHVSILRGLTLRPVKIAAKDLDTVEILTDENKISVLGGIGWGIAGTLIAGPIGLLVGGLLGANKKQHTVLVKLRSGKSFLANCNGNEYGQLTAAKLDSTITTITPAKDAREVIAKLPTPNEVDWEALGGKPPIGNPNQDGTDWSFLNDD